ncbi:hypothetical protein, partial [Bacteroides heparinolyticus]|uniref:hypothetical protein n=1 Tax=Prevotella heparinolytica TaxID=28113 RepID=UPI0035A1D1EC
PITSPEGLYFKIKPYWLSYIYICSVRHLCLSRQRVVSVGLNTCVCHDKGLQLSNKGSALGVKGSLLFCLTATYRCIQEISAR